MCPPGSEAPATLENPFFHRTPIRDRRFFFGRGEETRRALQMLRHGQCVSIVGPRRIGKTSLIFHLCDPKVQQEHGLGEKYLLVYLDCQGLGDLNVSQFYRRLWQQVKRALAERETAAVNVQAANAASVKGASEQELLTRLRQVLDSGFDEGELRTLCFDLGIDYENLPGDGKANKARELVTYLERRGRISDLVRIGEQVRPHATWVEGTSSFGEFHQMMRDIQKQGYTPVFLFDEFDTIALNPNLDPDLFSDLRSLVPGVVYVTASHDSLYDLTFADRSVLSSPFFNFFLPIDLGFLRPEEAQKMVFGLSKMGGQEALFSKEDLAFAFEVGGYHPFFLQLACYYLFEGRAERGELKAGDYASVRQWYTDDAEPHFRYAWNHLDANERKAVQLVHTGKASQLSGEQRQRLERKCLLYDSAFFSPVLAEFVGRYVAETGAREGQR